MTKTFEAKKELTQDNKHFQDKPKIAKKKPMKQNTNDK